jgi:hypothetical protein
MEFDFATSLENFYPKKKPNLKKYVLL